MSSTRSTRLRRIVGVAGVVAGCAAGLAAVVLLLDAGEPTVGAAPPTATAPPRPPMTGGGGGGGGGEGVEPPTSTPPSVDDLLAELTSASAAFNSPASMNLGDTTEVELLVSRELSVEELQSELEQTGELEGEQVRVSETMEAQLAGVGFAIQQITPAVQLVAGDGSTRWKWAVEAEESGQQRLHLTLSAIVDRNGRDRQYTIRTFARTLDVDVTLQDRLNSFFGGNWQWLWATLLVPLVGWALRQRRHRKHEPPPTVLQP